MSSDLALDFDFDGPAVQAALVDVEVPVETDPWLARRGLGFGCGDVPALLLAYGHRDEKSAPKGLRDRIAKRRTKHGVVPRILAEKARLLRPLKGNDAMHRGKLREVAVFDQWRTNLLNGRPSAPADAFVDPHSIRHASEVPEEWFPLVDRFEPRLVDTPDGWCRLVCGCLVCIQAKCSVKQKSDITQEWRDQLQGEMAVTGAPFGVLVCGEEWASWKGVDGPILTWWVERDEAEIALIRRVVRQAWTEVERLAAA